MVVTPADIYTSFHLPPPSSTTPHSSSSYRPPSPSYSSTAYRLPPPSPSSTAYRLPPPSPSLSSNPHYRLPSPSNSSASYRLPSPANSTNSNPSLARLSLSLTLGMNHDNDGPQSSEEGSGMHSPVLYGAGSGVVGGVGIGDGFRSYHPPHPSDPSSSALDPPTLSPYYSHPSHSSLPPHPSHAQHSSHLPHPSHSHQHQASGHGHGPGGAHGGGGGGGGGHHGLGGGHHPPPPPPHHHAHNTIVLDRAGGHLSHYSSNGHGHGHGSGSNPPSTSASGPNPNSSSGPGSGPGGSTGNGASAGQGQGNGHYLPPHHHTQPSPPHTLPPPRHYDPRMGSPTQPGGAMGEWYGRGDVYSGVPGSMGSGPLSGGPGGLSNAGGPISGSGIAGGGGQGGMGGGQPGGMGGSQGMGDGSQGGSPPAERRKEASNVVIACRQCRARKIRCDSTRPGCNNCARRNNQCEYDLVPKRRGPDKRPGTRQRSCKKRPPPDGSQPTAASQPASKRKKTGSSAAPQGGSTSPTQQQQQQVQQQQQQLQQGPGLVMDTKGTRSPTGGQPQGLYYAGGPGELRLSSNEAFVKLEHSPTYRYDNAYAKGGYAYGREDGAYGGHGLEHDSGVEAPRNISLQPLNALLGEQLSANWARLLKANSVQVIMQEITFVVNGTGHLLSFVNVSNLERILYSDQYTRVHPAFVWAALALANLMRSSNAAGQAYGQPAGRGAQGLNVALALFSEAKSAMEIAWADPSYAYAALVVALFESSAQPTYTHARALNALIELDDYIHQMRLTMNDTHHPDVSVYDNVPVIYYPPERESLDHRRGCPCPSSPSLSSTTPSGSLALDPYSTSQSAAGQGKIYIPPWESTWTQDQIRAEEVRRLCWSALSLVSTFLAQAATDGRRVPGFGVSDARSWRLLFPGEVIDRNAQSFNYPDGLTAKESVWALYCRSMLLWNFANTRFRNLISRGSLSSPPSLSSDLHSRNELGGPEDDERLSDEVAEVMREAQAIDESLDMHKCGLDGVLIWTTREYTHNIRMVVAQSLRSLQGYDRNVRSPSMASPGPIPGLYFKRKHAEDWVAHQEKIVKQVLAACQNLASPEAVQITERPWRVQWVFYQFATCLQLWDYERSLDEALHLGKKLLQIVDTMNYLWDCPENRTEAAQLRHRLTEACRLSGVEPPYSPRQMSMR